MIPGVNLGPLEIIIIGVIVILLFGVGRIGKIGGELGKGIREFRTAVKDENEKKDEESKNDDSKPAA